MPDAEFATPTFDHDENGVLSFEANPTDGNPTLTLSINGTQVYNVRYGRNVQRVAQENFRQRILDARVPHPPWNDLHGDAQRPATSRSRRACCRAAVTGMPRRTQLPARRRYGPTRQNGSPE